jgi:hypothetical protein
MHGSAGIWGRMLMVMMKAFFPGVRIKRHSLIHRNDMNVASDSRSSHLITMSNPDATQHKA